MQKKDELEKLQLPADDLDVVASEKEAPGPRDMRCDAGYCPEQYCARGYES